MNNLREQYLIDTFPDHSKEYRYERKVREIVDRQNNDNVLLLSILTALSVLFIPITLIIVVLFFSYEIDTNPFVGLITLSVACALLLFGRKVLKRNP